LPTEPVPQQRDEVGMPRQRSASRSATRHGHLDLTDEVPSAASNLDVKISDDVRRRTKRTLPTLLPAFAAAISAIAALISSLYDLRNAAAHADATRMAIWSASIVVGLLFGVLIMAWIRKIRRRAARTFSLLDLTDPELRRLTVSATRNQLEIERRLDALSGRRPS
jgi:hypothetical protein